MPATLRRLLLATVAVAGLVRGGAARGDDASQAALERRFSDTVLPFLGTHCVSCHGKQKPKAELDFGRFERFLALELAEHIARPGDDA